MAAKIIVGLPPGGRVLAGLLLASGVVVCVPAPAAAQPVTARVSVSTDGAEGNDYSVAGVVSADGRWVAFTSEATNLVPNDTNAWDDAFLHDRHTGTTTRVSLGPGGTQANGPSGAAAISADGRWVAFTSWASNLVVGDTNGVPDVFVHDRQTGATTRVSVFTGGFQGLRPSGNPAISADGRWVAFDSLSAYFDDSNQASDVFVHDRLTATTTRVSVGPRGVEGNADSSFPAISADGRWVTFSSWASNLVVGDTNGVPDVFVHDRQTGTTSTISLGPGGTQANGPSGAAAISADGRWVAFDSWATNLVAADTNAGADVFVHDRQTGATRRVSVGPGGEQGNRSSAAPALSADGRWAAFRSSANNLILGDTNGQEDVFVHDLQTGTTTRVSVGSDGVQANSASVGPALSADGRWVAFSSVADNLVPADMNGSADVFVHDRGDAACVITLAPAAAWAPAAGAADSMLVLTAADCAWTAVPSDPSWLSVTAGANGTGFGQVAYSLAVNTAGPRTGTITVEGQAFRVTQVSATEPMPPQELRAHLVVGNVVTLRWTPPQFGPAPTGFLLEGGLSSGQVLASVATGSVVPGFTFTAPSGSFYVRVRAENGAYRSAASNEIRLHVNVPVPPSAPAPLLGLVDGSTVALAWTTTYDGGTPTSLVLTVSGAANIWVHLPLGDRLSVDGVPAGTYTVALRALNAAGMSPPSNAVTLTVQCSGPPFTPTSVLVYREGRTVSAEWAPGTGGPAPSSYVLHVLGAWTGTLATTERSMSGAVAPGSYTLSVIAVNACGASSGSAPQSIVVP